MSSETQRIHVDLDAHVGAVAELFAGEPDALRVATLDAMLAAATDDAERSAIRAFARRLSQKWYDPDELTHSLPALLALIPRAYAVASRVGSDAFALCLRSRVEEAWELSWDHRALRAVTEHALQARRAEDPEAPLSPAWGLLELLLYEFSSFSASLTGNLAALEIEAGACRRQAAQVTDAAEQSMTGPAAELIRDELLAETEYYACVELASSAAHAYLGRQPDGLQRLDAALGVLDDYLERYRDDVVDASEIRNEANSLRALRDGAGARWLRVDRGEVVVLFPFAVEWPGAPNPGHDVLDAVETYASDWVLAGMRVQGQVSELEIDDSWQGEDPLGRRYQGFQVALPSLSLREYAGNAAEDGVAAPADELTIDLQVRFSELGNHHVRMAIPLNHALPHRINQAAMLSSPIFGNTLEIGALKLLSNPPSFDDDAGPRSAHDVDDGPIAVGAPAAWPRLSSIATRIVADLEEMLSRAARRSAPDTVPPRTIVRRGLSATHTTIAQASAFEGWDGPDQIVQRATDLRTTDGQGRRRPMFGLQPLLHPVPGGAISIADWAAYDVDALPAISVLSLNRELLVCNANVTLLASFHSPEYAVATVRGFIEFAQSLHGLFAGWQSEIAAFGQRLADQLDELDEVLRRATDAGGRGHLEQVRAQLAERIAGIESSQLLLNRSLVAAQETQHFIESPGLVTSPALRADLDRLLRANGFDDLTRAFDRVRADVSDSRLPDLLQVTQRRIDEAVTERRLAWERERAEAEVKTQQRRARLEKAAAAAIGVVGLSSLVSLLLDAQLIDSLWVMISLSVLLLGAMLAFVLLWLLPARRPAASADVPDSPASTPSLPVAASRSNGTPGTRRARIVVLDDPTRIGEVYDTLLVPNFRRGELDLREEIIARHRAGELDVLIAVTDEGDALGVAVGEVGAPIALLAYLAVSPHARGSGAGGELLRAAVSRWMAAPGVKAIVAEVARPDRHRAHPAYGDPQRRLAFYQRNGAKALTLPYFQPALRPGLEREHGVLLLMLACEAPCLDPSGDRFTRGDLLRSFIDDYLSATGDSPLEADEEGRALAAGLAATGGIRLLAPSEFRRIRSS